ncbi:hypothetical protein RchiOBHm_Chr2g0149951 [Rosa chinensis]|uniref:Uncharacterized protein n=1 Tax=Rosa chinensis TaxID=74649 RepID=A0A2P6RZW5_ROSCH|nr:hypothetical protein RchiOBHm_Chr2g0149951 [Rosa chinensis]
MSILELHADVLWVSSTLRVSCSRLTSLSFMLTPCMYPQASYSRLTCILEFHAHTLRAILSFMLTPNEYL